MKITIFLLFLSSACYSQTYEYAEILAISKGFKLECTFNFGTKYDSIEAYGKFRYPIDALDYSAKKGWEQIEVYGGGGITQYLLRRKKDGD
jgi:hypothetical protein